jgi:thioredoxin-related protein
MIYLTGDRTSVKPNCKKKFFYMSNILCYYGKSQKKKMAKDTKQLRQLVQKNPIMTKSNNPTNIK